MQKSVCDLITHRPISKRIYESASQIIPGGVNSPVRAFRGISPIPLIIEEGKGAEIIDVDGNCYIDFCCSWGALIHGHAHPAIVDAAQKRLMKGSSFGITTPIEEKLARKITNFLPHIKKIRFVSSGTEATMTAIRLARGYTGRDLIIKFEGHYHGHSDALLVKAGSGMIGTTPTATSKGVPQDVFKHTLVLPFNDLQGVRAVLGREDVKKNLAAIILEPVAANMGVVPPLPGFIEMLREETEKCGALLIFDEVITGFRVGLKGATHLFNITPDLSCFGKIIGGGFPAAAFGGKREIMDFLAPLGPVYQAGTLSGNPVAMAAGLSSLELLETSGFYEDLEEKMDFLLNPIQDAIEEKKLNLALQREGSMFTLFFGAKKVEKFQEFDLEAFRSFFLFLFERGIYFSPSQYEPCFISSAHTYEQLSHTRDLILEFLNNLK